MSVNLKKIRDDIRESIEILKRKKLLCPTNENVKIYINGEIAGLGIALHQIESEIFDTETDVYTKDPS